MTQADMVQRQGMLYTPRVGSLITQAGDDPPTAHGVTEDQGQITSMQGFSVKHMPGSKRNAYANAHGWLDEAKTELPSQVDKSEAN